MFIVINGNTLEISQDGVNNLQIVDMDNVREITPIFNDFNLAKDPSMIDQRNQYGGLPAMTAICLTMDQGDNLTIELQKVSNQATWNLGTQAALNQAVTDLKALI